MQKKLKGCYTDGASAMAEVV